MKTKCPLLGSSCSLPVLIAMCAVWTAPRVNAQAPDFSVENLQVCTADDGSLTVSFDPVYVPDFLVNPSEITAVARITVTGPATAPVDDQIITWFKPLDLGTCTGTTTCSGTCKPWKIDVDKTPSDPTQTFNVKAACLLTAVDCQCVVGKPVITKKKPKQDGQDATYTVTVTIDPDGLITESDESNNTVSVEIGPNGPSCIPTVSEWGLIAMTLLVLAAGTLVLRRGRQATA